MIEQSPIFNVHKIHVSRIRENNYNPNSVAPVEMKLLETSLLEDGWTAPIVCYKIDEDKDDNVYLEVIDGFHRYTLAKTSKAIQYRDNGFVPVVILDKPIEKRMASTIRHNRARGSHSIDLMVNIVKDLTESGMGDDWIRNNLGMDKDELLRLKQLSGLSSLFSDKEFSDSWELE